jgi:hypothetical protein
LVLTCFPRYVKYAATPPHSNLPGVALGQTTDIR